MYRGDGKRGGTEKEEETNTHSSVIIVTVVPHFIILRHFSWRYRIESFHRGKFNYK